MDQAAEKRGRSRAGADLSFSSAEVTIVRGSLSSGGAATLASDHALLDLCITPRPTNARGAFAPDGFERHRFERLGDIVFVPPGHPLRLRWDGAESQHSIRCELRGRLAQNRFGERMEWTGPRLTAALDIASHTVRLLLRRLAEEARAPRRDSKLLVGSIATQLTIELCRYFEEIAEETAQGGLAPWRLHVIDERLERDATPPSLEELAALCSVSVRQLTRGFLGSRGCTVGQYVHHHRLEMVKRLLATQESIKQVANAVGFASTSSLAHAFRRATGLTPRQYQQRIWRSKENV
ncbi:helix-turn-helix domain-containing protein [Novosphingobium sp.]|jgi:AraC family transcriptional regulator|uniref:helix-turn-helix domain-containing protein n=1 Tax=Novosphingobium sp. TaxID=1874826 RepID=UPI003D6CEBAE